MSSESRSNRADKLDLGRDLEKTQVDLSQWLERRLVGSHRLELSPLTVPSESGSSNETFLFSATWETEGVPQVRPLVLRIKPTRLRHFYEDTFEDQYRALEILGAEGRAPVPEVLWYEEDDSLFGAPFLIMQQVEGLIPPDNPPFNLGGFVFNASPSQRHELWQSAVEALCLLHSIELDGFGFLARPERGTSGLEQDLRQWESAAEWVLEGDEVPIMTNARKWLWANFPRRPATSLAWGDARLGNMVFKDFQCVALLDWEMLSLGGPLVDLGFWLFTEEHWPGPKLEGIGDRSDTLEIWEELTGHCPEGIEWYEAFAGYRLGVAHLGHAKTVHTARGATGDWLQSALTEYGSTDYEVLASPRRILDALPSYISS